MEQTMTAHLEAALQEARADLAEARQARAAALEKGDVEGVKDANARIEVAEHRITTTEDVLPEAREGEVRSRAEKRMLGVTRAYTSLLDQRAKDVERIENASRALAEAVQRLNGRHDDLNTLLVEGMVLADRFGLQLPDFERSVRPSADDRVTEALRSARAVKPSEATAPTVRLSALFYDTGGEWSLRRVLERLEGTSTLDLLEEAGPLHFASAEAWEARRVAEQNASRDRQDAARRAELVRVDSFLRDALAAGPITKAEVLRQAEEASIPIGGAGEATVSAAFARAGCMALEEERGGPLFWALPNGWDAERFSPLPTGGVGLAGMR